MQEGSDKRGSDERWKEGRSSSAKAFELELEVWPDFTGLGNLCVIDSRIHRSHSLLYPVHVAFFLDKSSIDTKVTDGT
jgi:hypothetical protein